MEDKKNKGTQETAAASAPEKQEQELSPTWAQDNIQDAIRCIQAEKLESDVVPWKDTLACAKLFDKINASCDEKALKTIEDIEAVPDETRAEL